MIPDAAVEAAGYAEVDGEVVCDFISDKMVRAALEAAAPHMFSPVLAFADEMDNVHGSIRGHVTTYQLRQALGVPSA